MMQLRIVLLACGFVSIAADTPFKNCGSSATIVSLDVNGCKALPCVLNRGTKVVFNAQLTAGGATQTLDSEISGIINGLPVPFSKDEKACDTSLESGSCPLAAGDSITFKASVDLLKEYPPIAVTMRWKLKDDQGNDMACCEIPAHIH